MKQSDCRDNPLIHNATCSLSIDLTHVDICRGFAEVLQIMFRFSRHSNTHMTNISQRISTRNDITITFSRSQYTMKWIRFVHETSIRAVNCGSLESHTHCVEAIEPIAMLLPFEVYDRRYCDARVKAANGSSLAKIPRGARSAGLANLRLLLLPRFHGRGLKSLMAYETQCKLLYTCRPGSQKR